PAEPLAQDARGAALVRQHHRRRDLRPDLTPGQKRRRQDQQRQREPPRSPHGGRPYGAAACCSLQAILPCSSSSRNSSSLSLSPPPARFSSRCWTWLVPGMGNITGLRCSSHARATAAVVTPLTRATWSSAPPCFDSDPAASGNQGMKPM